MSYSGYAGIWVYPDGSSGCCPFKEIQGIRQPDPPGISGIYPYTPMCIPEGALCRANEASEEAARRSGYNGFSGISMPQDGHQPKFGVGEIVMTDDGKTVMILSYYYDYDSIHYRYQCDDGSASAGQFWPMNYEPSLSAIEGRKKVPSHWPNDAGLRCFLSYEMYGKPVRLEDHARAYSASEVIKELKARITILESELKEKLLAVERSPQECSGCSGGFNIGTHEVIPNCPAQHVLSFAAKACPFGKRATMW